MRAEKVVACAHLGDSSMDTCTSKCMHTGRLRLTMRMSHPARRNLQRRHDITDVQQVFNQAFPPGQIVAGSMATAAFFAPPMLTSPTSGFTSMKNVFFQV